MLNSLIDLQRPNFFGTKNKNSVITLANQEYLNFIGDENILGQSALSFFSHGMAKEFYKQDRNVENTREMKRLFNVHYCNKALSSIFFIKQAKLENKKVIGTNFYGWKLNNINLIQLSILLNFKVPNANKLIGENSLEIIDKYGNLNNTEYVIIYLIALGFRPYQISSILNYTLSYVYNVISDLKVLISFIGNINNLREYAIEELKLHKTIPDMIYCNPNKFIKILE